MDEMNNGDGIPLFSIIFGVSMCYNIINRLEIIYFLSEIKCADSNTFT
jgi:hypothetical protein